MIRIDRRHEGLTGLAHGGWTAYQLADYIGEQVTVAFRSPIPIETDLAVELTGASEWRLFDPTNAETTILEATPWVPDCPSTDPISIAEAAEATTRFPLTPDDHPAPRCLSCGYHPESLGIMSGPLGDGRFGTVWRPTGWALDADGAVDPGALWASMDCAAGWYVSCEGPDHRPTVTVQLAVETYVRLQADTDYALVCWNGDYEPEWDGRKRGACAALFDAQGTLVANSRSFWVAMSPIDTPD